MSTIFINEKPSQSRDYLKILKLHTSGKTNGYYEGYSDVMKTNVIITWAVGHLIGICSPEKHNEDWKKWSKEHLPMIPKTFKYEPIKDTASQFKIVKSLFTRNDIDCIYYAGDSGREGIYIQALIRNQIFKTKPSFDEKVVWIDSTTEQAILNGIKTAKPYSAYLDMINSGYARAISDWEIGMNFTEAFTLTSGGFKNTIKVGRVMTPTLAMIVNRQKEIDNFVKTPYFGIKADKISWKAVKGSRFFESDLLYNESGFKKKQDAVDLLNEFNKDKHLTVDNVSVKKNTEYAPNPFNLADLQAYCSRVYKISPAQTLAYVQKLYETQLVTYPRTDSRYLSSAVQYELKGKGYIVPDRYVDDKKITDHYAIIPTFHGNPSRISDNMESRIYYVIEKRFLDLMRPPFIYNTVSITYKHKNGEYFFETFRNVLQAGYKDSFDDDEEEISTKPIPEKGLVIVVPEFTLNEMETKPPVAYTTGSLIIAMEKAGNLVDDADAKKILKESKGIGTSATRASIIEKLEKSEFISTDKKQKISATEKGMKLIPIIEKYDATLVSPMKTAEMEEKLFAISQNQMTQDEYIKSLNTYVTNTVKNILGSNTDRLDASSSHKTHTCPCCGETMKFGKFGWYCSCKYSLSNMICGHKMQESDLEDLISKGSTKVYSFKSKAGKTFKAKLVLNKAEKKNDFQF